MRYARTFSKHPLGSVFTYPSAPACTNRSISNAGVTPNMLSEDIFLSVMAFVKT